MFHKSIRAIATVEENQSGSKIASSQKVNFVGFESSSLISKKPRESGPNNFS